MASRREVENYLVQNTETLGVDLHNDQVSCERLAQVALDFAVKQLDLRDVLLKAFPNVDVDQLMERVDAGLAGNRERHDGEQTNRDDTDVVASSRSLSSLRLIPKRFRRYAEIKNIKVTEILLALERGHLKHIHGIILRPHGHDNPYVVFGNYGVSIDRFMNTRLTQKRFDNLDEHAIMTHPEGLRYFARIIVFDQKLHMTDSRRFDLSVKQYPKQYALKTIVMQRTWIGDLPEDLGDQQTRILVQADKSWFTIRLSQNTTHKVLCNPVTSHEKNIEAIALQLETGCVTNVAIDMRRVLDLDYIFSNRVMTTHYRYGRSGNRRSGNVAVGVGDSDSDNDGGNDGNDANQLNRQRKRARVEHTSA